MAKQKKMTRLRRKCWIHRDRWSVTLSVNRYQDPALENDAELCPAAWRSWFGKFGFPRQKCVRAAVMQRGIIKTDSGVFIAIGSAQHTKTYSEAVAAIAECARWASAHNTWLVFVPVTTWKGRKRKGATLQEASALYGFEGKNDNIADAIMIGHWWIGAKRTAEKASVNLREWLQSECRGIELWIKE